MNNLLTNSRLSTFRACPRKHDYRYEQGFVPVREEENTRFGTLIHKGLEAWMRALMVRQHGLGQGLGAALVAIQKNTSDPFDLVRAEEMMIAYDRRWLTETIEQYEVLAVEAKFEIQLVNPETWRSSRTFTQGGKVDAVLRRRDDGRIVVEEHKSSNEEVESEAATYWQRLVMNPQISLYVIATEASSTPVNECLYDVLRKPGIRPFKETPADKKKFTKDGALYANQHDHDETAEEFRLRLRATFDEDPARYFQRREIPRLNSEIKEYMVDAWLTADQIRATRAAGIAPRNPDSCFKYGVRCAYFDACANGLVLSESPDFKQLTNPHTELTEEGTNVSNPETVTA